MILFFNIFFGSYFAMQVCSECTASFPGLPLLDVVNVFCLISDLDYTDGTEHYSQYSHVYTSIYMWTHLGRAESVQIMFFMGEMILQWDN